MVGVEWCTSVVYGSGVLEDFAYIGKMLVYCCSSKLYRWYQDELVGYGVDLAISSHPTSS